MQENRNVLQLFRSTFIFAREQQNARFSLPERSKGMEIYERRVTSMKKLLAMVLALVMTLSLAVSANAAFKDADKVSDTYEEAVAVLNGMGVFKGYEDGSFQPKGDITRAEVAAIVYRVYTADVKDAKASMYATYNKFSDMAGAGWAQGYIGYCANAALVKGYPNGTFQPSGKVTGYEVLAMILRAIGYDQNNEFTGPDWALHVAQTAQQAKILANVKGVDLNAPATRELVAELLFRAIADAPMVTYTAAFGYQTVSFNGKKDSNKTFSENDTLGYKSFKLKSAKEADEFGRPTTKWTYDVGDKSTTVEVEALATYTEAAKNCDIYADSGLKKGTKLDVYTNSKTSDGTYTVADNKDDSKQADQGRLTLVYEDRLVNIDTYLAEVTKFVAEKTDSKGHTTSAYAIVDKNVHGYKGKLDTKFETKDEFKADDMVLVTIANGDIQSMVKAESKNAVLTNVSGNSKNIDNIQKVKGLDKADAAVNCTATFAPKTMTLGKTYNFYFDTYGNVIGADELSRNYAVLDTLYIEHNKGVDTAYGDLYFFDGDRKTDATIDEVAGSTVKTSGKNAIEVPASKNDGRYYTVYSYSIDNDGAYTLSDSEFKTATAASFQSGDKYLTITKSDKSTERLQLSKDSQILLQTEESPKGTFQNVTGYADLKSFEGTKVQYVLDNNNYVDMIYVYASEVSSRTVFIYDTKAYDSNWNDGKPYATFKAYELVDGKLEDTKVDIYYVDGNDTASSGVDSVGLYEITMSSDKVYNVVKEYYAETVTNLTDGNRITTMDKNGAVHYFDLDGASVAKFEGTSVKGTVDTDWTAKDLTNNSYVYVQYDNSKSGDTHDALVVYDMYTKVSTTVVDGSKTTDVTSPVQYVGKAFADITVDLAANQTVTAVTMKDSKNTFQPTIKNEAGKATISSTDLVTGDITITVTTDVNTAIGKLASVKLDGETVDLATGYDTLAEALDKATKINKADVNPQYVLTVTTKQNSQNTGAVWGNVQWASSKTAAANVTFDNDGELSTVTLSGANTGTYVVIRLSDFGDTAYYAYVID